MLSNFSEETQEILTNAKKEMLELKHPYVGTEHLVLAILHNNYEIKNILKKYNLTYERFKKELLSLEKKGQTQSEIFIYTPTLKKVLENTIIDSNENKVKEISPEYLLTSIIDLGEGNAIKILLKLNINLDDMYDELVEKVFDNKNKNFSPTILESLGTDLTQKKTFEPVIGREKELNYLQEILGRKTKNNPLLIGEPGVGKTAIVEALAEKIKNGNVPINLKNKRIISLDMASIVAGTKYRGEFEDRMKKILEEVENNSNIILFIDEIHTLIGAGGAEGAIDASNIIKPALARGNLRCIGATTTEEYQKSFEKDKALERRFQIIKVNEPSKEETFKIIEQIKPIYEKYHNVFIPPKLIPKLINLTDKYVYNRYRPDKQIDILDEVCSKVNIKNNLENIKFENNLNKIKKKKIEYIKKKDIKKAYEMNIKEHNLKNKKALKKKIVTIKDIANAINQKTSIPIYEILNNQKEIIKNIEQKLKNSIIGQEEAINNLIDITKRIKLGYKENKCPSLLFCGSSGIGKTKLANTFGNLISNTPPINIDMSEYSDSTSINKFIGSNAGYVGYDDNKYLLSQIKENPNSVIIFDEIDKAHPKIINLLYQILDNGQIKDAKNNNINLSNNIIIMTTNKGTNQKNIGFINEKNNINDLKEILSQPLINRIDNIIFFNNLTKQNIQEIINKELQKLKEKYLNVQITISEQVNEEIINESEYETHGARKIEKIIQNKIENVIIDNIINKQNKIYIDSILTH